MLDNYKYYDIEIQNAMFLSCYKYNINVMKLLYKRFRPFVSDDDLNVVLYNSYFDDKLEIFNWIVNNYTVNLYDIDKKHKNLKIKTKLIFSGILVYIII